VAAVAVVQKRVRQTLGNVEQVRRGLERRPRRTKLFPDSNAVPGASQKCLRMLFSCVVVSYLVSIWQFAPSQAETLNMGHVYLTGTGI
jgi:hypothetical protein